MNRSSQSVDSERPWSGIEELSLLMELLNFQVEISTLKDSNFSIKVGFSSPLQGKTSESNLDQTTLILGWTFMKSIAIMKL
jgi:hypothetical protein